MKCYGDIVYNNYMFWMLNGVLFVGEIVIEEKNKSLLVVRK